MDDSRRIIPSALPRPDRAQGERVRAEADAKTESLHRQKEQAREQAKIQNYLQSKAALEVMLQNPALSEAEKKQRQKDQKAA